MAHRPAFSLIELLVVVAIIALLIAIVLPALGSAREASRTSMCSQHLRQMHQGWEMAVVDENGRALTVFRASSGQSAYWDTAIIAYLDPGKLRRSANPLWICPSYMSRYGKHEVGSLPHLWYAVNNRWREGDGVGAITDQPWPPPNAATYPLFSDPDVRDAGEAWAFPSHMIGNRQWMNDGLGFFHARETAPVAFADGHVGVVNREDLAAEGFSDHPLEDGVSRFYFVR